MGAAARSGLWGGAGERLRVNFAGEARPSAMAGIPWPRTFQGENDAGPGGASCSPEPAWLDGGVGKLKADAGVSLCERTALRHRTDTMNDLII